MANKNNQFCYMCGKSVNEVNKLIKGEYGYICDSCISIASDLLNDEEEESITNNMQLATPSQIKAHLDQYVIGQDEESCTVYGMPKAIAETGAVDEVVTLRKIADAITKHVGVL